MENLNSKYIPHKPLLDLNNSMDFIECTQNIPKVGDKNNVSDNSSWNSDVLPKKFNKCPLNPVHLSQNDDIRQTETQDTKAIVQLLQHEFSNREESKQYSEREITYNILLRKLVDQYLDRTVTYSQQPKRIIFILKSVLERNFPEYTDSFHRERICTYLKACKRKAKKKNGEPYVRIKARYLNVGTASRLAEQIYLEEHNYLVNAISNINNNNNNGRSLNQSVTPSDYYENRRHEIPNFNTFLNQHNQRQDQSHRLELAQNRSPATSHILNNNVILKGTDNSNIPINSSGDPISISRNPMSQQYINGLALAKLWEQIAQSLLFMADCLDAGQDMFSNNQPSNGKI
ncbi:unnamed protein product [Heterobilharzia americana]|nr:unnamed protein product [Heterobilharzia americana]